MPARILVVAGSTRPGTPAARLAAEAARLLSLSDAETVLLSLADYELPLHDPDGDAPALSPVADRLARRIARQDGLFLAFSQIDGSIPAHLKNALEWTGRLESEGGKPRRPFEALPIALGAAGDGGGANDGAIEAVARTLTALGAEILDPSLDAPDLAFEFNATGRLAKGATLRGLERLVEQLLERTQAIGRFA